MPLFFFHVLNDLAPDLVGTDLACAGTARREAIRTAGQILSDSAIDIHDGIPGVMHVRDDKGGVVCNLQFSTSSDEPPV